LQPFLSLHFPPRHATLPTMSNKELVADLVQRLPDDASLLEIAREIEFVAGVREGFAQLDRGEGVPLEEVEKQLPSWISK
jgi:predicted transcriptional regulator